MQVLEVAPSISHNPTFRLLCNALKNHTAVKGIRMGVDCFWDDTIGTDIVHFHWPEALFRWRSPTSADLIKLDQRLQWWKARSLLVCTIHNRYPHYKDTPISHRLYETVYSRMDGFIHCGQASLDEFRQPYPAFGNVPHVVVPLGLQSEFPNTVTRRQTRDHLKLPNGAAVVLAFGELRHIEEGEQILRGFSAMGIPHKRLLIVINRLPKKEFLRRFLFSSRSFLNPNIRCHVGFVPIEDVQYFFNAANVLLISRLQILNSGNLQLGFTFGNVVVGPDTGVVGEILRNTGNPVFVPGNTESLTQALEEGYVLSKKNHGRENGEYAKKHWNWDLLGHQHVEFFGTLLQTRESR